MRAYLAHDDGGTEELGEAKKEQVLSLIDRAEASLATEKQFGVGFYRSEQDFLEVRPVGKSQYMIWSDVIASNTGSGFLGLLSKKKAHIEKVVVGREAAAEAANCYMDFSREAFERKYS